MSRLVADLIQCLPRLRQAEDFDLMDPEYRVSRGIARPAMVVFQHRRAGDVIGDLG